MMQKWLLDGWIYYRFRLYRYTQDNARFIVKQARLESGNYTSYAFETDNNIFGMSRVAVRPTTQTGWRMSSDGVNTIGVYPSLDASIRDRKMWDDFNKIDFRAPLDVFIEQTLDKGYNGNQEYAQSVLAVNDQVDEAKRNMRVGGAALLVGVSAIFALKNSKL